MYQLVTNLLNFRFSDVAVHSIFLKSLLATLRPISIAFLRIAFVTLFANFIELDSRASNSATPGEVRKTKRTMSNQVIEGLQSSMGTKHNQTKLIASILVQWWCLFVSFYDGDCLHWYKTIYILLLLCQLTCSLAFGAPFVMLNI